MRGMIWLHQHKSPILVNPDQIETVFPSTDEGWPGSYIYFQGEEDPIHVDEDMETIDRKVRLS